ncbi:hypothetical protein [Bartonella sp. DGB2]|uniref:hypothetical protein n=1 Tax=Bartonella sp. DGB2 TaxID=3388426 RepID=UPI003990225E
MSQNAYFHTLDLTQIPAPDFVEEVSYEAIRQAAIAKLKALEPNYSVLESDPAIKVIEAFCYIGSFYCANALTMRHALIIL